MATPHYIVKKVGEEYVTVPVENFPQATKATYVVWGSILTMMGLRRHSLMGLAVAGVGGWMAWSALNGRNPSLSALLSQVGADRLMGGGEQGPSFQHDQRSFSAQKPIDEVDEASMESFPASDPPAKMAAASDPPR